MGNTYKKEYIEKVKQKVNDVQASKNSGANVIKFASTDKRCEVRNGSGVVKDGRK